MPPSKWFRRVLTALVIVFAAGLALSYLYVSHRTARLVSDALTRALGQPTTVSLVTVSGAGGITLYNLKVKNPPGFGRPELLTIRALSLRPKYRESLDGRYVFSSIRVTRPSLAIEKNASGVWNYQPVLDFLKRRKPSRFTIDSLTVTDAEIHAPGRIGRLRVPDGEIQALSNIAFPANFRLEVEDEKGATLKAEGVVDVFGARPSCAGTVTANVKRLGSYITAPKGLDLGRADLSAKVKGQFKDGDITAFVETTLEGAHYGYIKGPASLNASAVIKYGRSSDTLTLSRGLFKVSKVGETAVYGTVKGLSTAPDFDLTVTPARVRLTEATQYLPEGLTLDGIASPGRFRVKGGAKQGVSLEGSVTLDNASVKYKDTALTGVSGPVALAYDRGAVNGKLDLSLLGGKLKGAISYDKGKGAFELTSAGLDIGAAGGRLAGWKGLVDASVSGENSGQSVLNARYTATVKGLSDSKGRLRAESITLGGEGAYADGKLTTSGRCDTGKVVVSGHELVTSGADYSYAPGRLDLRSVAFKEKDIAASAAWAAVAFSEGGVSASVSGVKAAYKDEMKADGGSLTATLKSSKDGGFESAKGAYRFTSAAAYDVTLNETEGAWSYSGDKVELSARGSAQAGGFDVKGRAEPGKAGGLINTALSGNLDITRPGALKPLLDRLKLGVTVPEGRAVASFSLEGPDIKSIGGSGTAKLYGVGMDKNDKALVRDVSGDIKASYKDNTLTVQEGGLKLGAKVAATISGKAVKGEKGWSGTLKAKLQEADIAALQEEFLDYLPAKLKWADVKGRASAEVEVGVQEGVLAGLDGSLGLKEAVLILPDDAVTVGPMDGSVPIHWRLSKGQLARPAMYRQEEFERENFGALYQKYSKRPADAGLTVKKASYGLVSVEDLSLKLTPGDGYYEISWFGFSGFQGKGAGYGTLDFTGKTPRYGVSLVINDLSLTELCRQVPGIKGYLSGKVDGLARVLVSEGGYQGVRGAGVFWSKDAPDEKRLISKDFLKRLMGKMSLASSLIGNRFFDTGEMDVIFSDGYIVFDKLLILHTNFLGSPDLNIRVAPVSNKIAIEHFMEVLRDVKARGGGGGSSRLNLPAGAMTVAR